MSNGYVTKDSGQRQEFSTGMVRDSAAKELRPDLIWMPLLHAFFYAKRKRTTVDERKSNALRFFLGWYRSKDADGVGTCADLLRAICDVETMAGRGRLVPRWAALMGRGAIKYGERNWEKARTEEELKRFKASAFRHFVQWIYELDTEEDHAAAVAFNLAGAEYVKQRMAVADEAKSFMTMTFRATIVPPSEPEKTIAELEAAATKVPPPAWEPKVGDRVRVSEEWSDAGSEATIVEIDADDTIIPYRLSNGLWLKRHEIELASGAV